VIAQEQEEQYNFSASDKHSKPVHSNTFIHTILWQSNHAYATSWRDRLDAGHLDATFLTLRTSWRQLLIGTTWH